MALLLREEDPSELVHRLPRDEVPVLAVAVEDRKRAAEPNCCGTAAMNESWLVLRWPSSEQPASDTAPKTMRAGAPLGVHVPCCTMRCFSGAFGTFAADGRFMPPMGWKPMFWFERWVEPRRAWPGCICVGGSGVFKSAAAVLANL